MIDNDGSVGIFLAPDEGRVTNYSVSARKGGAGTVFKIELLVTDYYKVGRLIEDMQQATANRRPKAGE